MAPYIKHLAVLLLLFIGIACQQDSKSLRDSTDRVLAQVHNKMLYLSDMEGMFPKNSSVGDSSMIINTFIEKWIRDVVLMHEAERNISKDLNIDELVRDYRASLIRHNFEKNMVEILMDSTITDTELNAYYETNKEQYRLPQTILRCHLVKVPKDVEGLSEFKTLWKGKTKESYVSLLEYATSHASVYMLEDSSWYKIEDISLQLPKGTITPGNVSSSKEIAVEDDEFRYFFRLIDVVKHKKIAPLSYVKDQASKVILHNRKIKLLKAKKEEMYERELRRNNVKVF